MHCEQLNLFKGNSTAADQVPNCARPVQLLGQCIRVSCYCWLEAGSECFQDVDRVGRSHVTTSKSAVVMYLAWLFQRESMSQTCDSRDKIWVGMMWRLKARGGSEVVTPEVFASRLPAEEEGEPALKASYLDRE